MRLAKEKEEDIAKGSDTNTAEPKVLYLHALRHLSVLHSSFPHLCQSKLLIRIRPSSLTLHRWLTEATESLGRALAWETQTLV